MIRIQLQGWPGNTTLYDVVDERMIARDMTKADAQTIAALLNRQPAPETLTPSCPKCDGRITNEGGHGSWCPNQACKWGWEVEMDGSPLRPPGVTPKPSINPDPSEAISGCGCTVCVALQQKKQAEVNRKLDEFTQTHVGFGCSCPVCLDAFVRQLRKKP